jgi:predicted PurR-regulated permease PerM
VRDDAQRIALGVAALFAVVLIFWITAPIGIGILLGTFLAFMAEPIYERLQHAIGMRWASLATVLGASTALAAVLGGLGVLFVTRGTVLAGSLADAFKPGGAGARIVEALGRLSDRVGISREELNERAQAAGEQIATRTASFAASIASTTGGALLGLLFAMMAMYYVLRNWPSVLQRAQDTLPLKPQHTVALLNEFRVVGRTTLLGAIGTGLAQGVFAWIGYAIVGVPEPLFFGAATAVASFVPVVGVLIVIVPIVVVEFASGHPIAGTLELAWSLVFVVGVCDYFIRPRLTRGETKVPALVTFAALFGGVETFGIKGLILGPVLMSLALAVLRIYGDEARRVAGPHVSE